MLLTISTKIPTSDVIKALFMPMKPINSSSNETKWGYQTIISS